MSVSKTAKTVSKLAETHMIWRCLVTALVIALAALGYWSWAWLALGLATFYMVGNISVTLLVGGIAKAQSAKRATL